MTTLYKPVLIESAEQAEALPIGTVTLPPARHRGNAVATVKGRDELWRETGSEQPFTDVEMVDEIALVPIEAEEELRRTYALPASTFPGLSWPEQRDEWKRRLVTPWEAVWRSFSLPCYARGWCC